MKLQTLLKKILDLTALPNIDIMGLQIDSRRVKKGDLFFAYPGYVADGRNFISEAIARGAVIVLKEANQNDNEITYQQQVPIVAIKNLSKKIGEIASTFYQNDSKDILYIGVTGTNGKTSCVQLLAGALQQLDKACGTVGTIGYGLYGNLQVADRTTPDPVMMQSIIANFIHEQANAIIMEVSSHALVQGRTNGIPFQLGIFTNLTQDHLDYHSSMTDYTAAKKKLFERDQMQYAVFNLDDPIGLKWTQEFKDRLTVCGYTLKPNVNSVDIPVVCAKNIALHENGMTVDVVTPWGEGTLQSQLLGRFNVANLLAIVSALGLLGYDLNAILKVITTLPGIPGRMQKFGGNNQPTVIIDFAHTPDALAQALKAAREYCRGKLFCVFGCGGDRDRSKRAQMGAMVEQYADHVIVTSDNPRTEDPNKIIEDILLGIQTKNAVMVEPNRWLAIQKAFENVAIDDMILIAGKGHEMMQIIGNQRIPFDEVKIVKTFLSQWSKNTCCYG